MYDFLFIILKIHHTTDPLPSDLVASCQVSGFKAWGWWAGWTGAGCRGCWCWEFMPQILPVPPVTVCYWKSPWKSNIDKVWQSVTKCDKVWQSVTKCLILRLTIWIITLPWQIVSDSQRGVAKIAAAGSTWTRNRSAPASALCLELRSCEATTPPRCSEVAGPTATGRCNSGQMLNHPPLI